MSNLQFLGFDMCVVIDANVMFPVFDETESSHWKFKPVLKWIREKKGKMVWAAARTGCNPGG